MSFEKYINDYGKLCYRGVTPDTAFADLAFHDVPNSFPEDRQFALHTNLGSLTVLDRMTGFGWRDVETGFRLGSDFWLASGNCDVRHSGAKTMQEAIDWVKANANTCVPDTEARK